MTNEEAIKVISDIMPGCGKSIPHTEEEKCEALYKAIEALEADVFDYSDLMDITQTAVDAQITINRLVAKCNQLMSAEAGEPE